ncbi:MAG: glycerol-3-phosphate acyltransferase, partial [Candidatus Omnitrophota bacterium]|nr:glycerol-3-phosphate acyltransferase [Candidatus Omnitrophota bacterium]
DAAKGYLAVSLPGWFLPEVPSSAPFLLLVGATAIAGHSFPAWIGFRGGKGVATSLGVFLSLTPVPALLTLLVWSTTFAVFRIISVGSLVSAVAFPAIMFITYRAEADLEWYLAMSLGLCGFIFYTHRDNIKRLTRGDEKRIL